MPTPQENMERTLVECATHYGRDTDLITPAMGWLEPLFAIAQSSYPLSCANDLDREMIASAIQKATGENVNSVVFVSASHEFFPQATLTLPEWMSEEEFGETQRTFFGIIAEALETAMVEPFPYDLPSNSYRSLPSNVVDTISDCLHRFLLEGLSNALAEQTKDLITREEFYEKFWTIIDNFLCAVVTGDREEVDRYEPIIRLLPKAIPLGRRIDEPETWLVLVK